MNDVDQRFVSGEDQPARTKLTPRPAEPIQVCSLFSDGGIRVEQGSGLSLIELQRILFTAALSITDRTIQRGAAMERVLAGIHARYEGLDAETEQAIATVLGQRQPSSA
jgi:hypothetical protein